MTKTRHGNGGGFPPFGRSTLVAAFAEARVVWHVAALIGLMHGIAAGRCASLCRRGLIKEVSNFNADKQG
jgi:hypothetical protein